MLATLEVTAVDDQGGITDATIIDGGAFEGDDLAGEYNLDGAQAQLLMMAKKQTGEREQQQAQTDLGPLVYTSIGAGVACAVLALALVARRQFAASIPEDVLQYTRRISLPVP